MSSAAQSFSRMLRRRAKVSALVQSIPAANPQPLSLTRASSDGNDGVLSFLADECMSSRTSSLWIRFARWKMVCWTDEQLDYLRNDFGISNEWSSNDNCSFFLFY